MGLGLCLQSISLTLIFEIVSPYSRSRPPLLCPLIRDSPLTQLFSMDWLRLCSRITKRSPGIDLLKNGVHDSGSAQYLPIRNGYRSAFANRMVKGLDQIL